MQEIVLILSSLAGVATAAAIRRIPKDKNQLLSLGANSQIKSQITSLKIEKDILTKTISRLYQEDSDVSKIQKEKLLLKYQHQLGIILARLERLEQTSNHPDLGPVGDGLITLMDQKLSKLDDRLHELSSKVTSTKVETEENIPKVRQESKPTPAKTFNFEKPKDNKADPTEVAPAKSGQSFELTTLTNVSRKEPKFPSFEETKPVVKPMPRPRVMKTELISPKEEIVQETIQTKPKVEDKIEIVQSVSSKPTIELKPDINAKIAKITEHKALPEPAKEKQVTTQDNDDFDDDADDLDKIKGDIMKVLSKLDQAEVE